jgi:hypothetical protein
MSNEEMIASGIDGAENAEIDLPPGWHVTTDGETNRIYWYHDDGVSTTWDKPDWVPKGWIPTEDQWQEFTADEGQKYYYNARTGTTQWEAPGTNLASRHKYTRSKRLAKLAKIKRKTQHLKDDIEIGSRNGRATTDERVWSNVRAMQDQRREENNAAVGLELTQLELKELSQVQENR